MTTVNGKRVIRVGTIGHIDHLNARRVAIAIQQLGITAAVAAERLSKLGGALDMLEVHNERPDFVICQLMMYASEDLIQEYVPLKSQPFWTQQGRHKKGGRGKY